ncbi:unnamed protein product [Cyprideis torosa]|uniref:Uncharacterized protein n=1 Tax=Cyprideis torosa TaxID=163714 RepID=A0A7R8X1A8_9CRUS|nr:unnamed protein product [Cyprideis torosa]CAG0911206.1 unnamed protein product [Cyprideis torosa]
MAMIAERYMVTGEVDEEVVWSEIKDCFVDRLGARTDVVVLGCTHYPFMADIFRRLAPWPVDWLNPAESIARQAKRRLQQHGSVKEVQDIAEFTAGRPAPDMLRFLSGFGLKVR